jgi:superfamily II DNA or RNA helicase
VETTARSHTDPSASGRNPGAHVREHLLEMARGRFGAIPAELLVEHLLDVTDDADFPVREAALEALIRRSDFAVRDGLCVAKRPRGRACLGEYTTERVEGFSYRQKNKSRNKRAKAKTVRPKARAREKASARPYVTWVQSLSPLAGSCNCADYLRSSLGLCKHLLVVLDDAFGSTRAARSSGDGIHFPVGSHLAWDPVLPLRGSLDRLSGLSVVGELAPTLGRRLRGALRKGRLDTSQLGLAERVALLQALKDAAREAQLECTPAARAVVEEELERAERLLTSQRVADRGLPALRTLKRTLYDYQRQGVERFLRSGRMLLADDMGLGKTTQAIAACHALYESGVVRRGLLIVPASLKSQWLREWRETSTVPVEAVDGPAEARQVIYRKHRAGFLIIGYEQLLRDVESIQALSPEMVVLDEAQRIKNYATKSAVYVKALAPAYRLVLTGTPLENRLEELASILDWVDDVALAPKWRLVPWHTTWEGDGAAGKTGARHLEVLRKRLEPCFLRRIRKEVLSQLPARTDTRVPVEMTPQQLGAHAELDQPIKQLMASARRRPLRQPEFLKLMQLLTQQRIISNGLGQVEFEGLWPSYEKARPTQALLDGLFSPKLHELRRLIGDLCLQQGRKVVVFSQWRRMLRLSEWALRDVLGDAGIKAVFFTGAESQQQRSRAVVDFHDDPRVRVMFLSDAGGVGLNLQRASNACINLELPWNPSVLEQRIGRIYRIGQKAPIDVFTLVNEQGIEARISSVVSAKRALFTGLFDGTSDEIKFDTAASFLQRVEALLEPGALPSAPAAMGTVENEPEEDDDLESVEEKAAAHELRAPGAPHDLPQPALTESRGPSRAEPITELFARLAVERNGDGSLRIEAPADVAGSLVALFEGMAKLLGSRTT